MKKAIITGASSGLGLELGKQLQVRGIDVVNVSRKESDFKNIKCDLSSDEDLKNAIDEIRNKHNDFDLLILNAGIMPKAKIGEINFDIDEVFKINVTSNIKIVNALIDLIKSKPCDIVIIGSVSSFKANDQECVYSGTKFGLLGFIKNLQFELNQNDVRVIGIHPGGFNSNLRGEGVVKEGYMDTKDICKIILSTLELPRLIEVSEMILSRKKINYNKQISQNQN